MGRSAHTLRLMNGFITNDHELADLEARIAEILGERDPNGNGRADLADLRKQMLEAGRGDEHGGHAPPEYYLG